MVVATDPNMDNLTYTLGGTDRASFGINRGTGQLMTKAMLNKEDKDTYMVTVTATDPSGLSATVNVTIKVEGPRRKRCPRVRFRHDQQNGGGEHGCRRGHRQPGGGKRR